VNTTMRGFLLAGGVATLVAFAQPNTASAEGPRQPTTVTVTNMRSVPVTVFVDWGPFDVRLGTVDPLSRKTLSLSPYLTETDVRVFVHPEDGPDLVTPDLDVTPGASLEILVPTNNVGFVPAPPAEVIPNPGRGTTTITVQNQRAQDVTLYIERGRFEVRLGTVAAHQEQTIEVPAWLTRSDKSVEVFVHPRGGLDLASQPFELKPGAHLLVKVPGHRS
jgi:hypothetical protein